MSHRIKTRNTRSDSFGGLITRASSRKRDALGPRHGFERVANSVVDGDTLGERHALRKVLRLPGQVDHVIFYQKYYESARILGLSYRLPRLASQLRLDRRLSSRSIAAAQVKSTHQRRAAKRLTPAPTK